MNHGIPRLASLTVTVASLFIFAGCSGAQARHDRHMERGREYFAAENFDKARVEFSNALQITPNDAEARFMSGRVAEKLGSIRDAVGAYQGAIELNADHVEARANLARVYVFASMPDRAMEVVEPGLAKHPDDADLLTARGAARVLLKDKQGALRDAERAVEVAPTNENAIALLAAQYRQSEDPSRAMTLLKRSIAAVPQTVDLRLLLSSLYLSSGDREQAQAELEKVVQLKPDVPGYRFQLALLYSRGKELDKAERVLKEGVDRLPDNHEMKLGYVEFLTSQRSYAAGETALRGFIAKDAKDIEMQLALGALQDRNKNSQAALATYQKIIAAEKDSAQGLAARNRIAAIHLREGRPAEARKLVDEVLAKNARDNDALIMRGNLALENGETASAITDLRAVLRDQPAAVGVMRVLARAHLAAGDASLAEEQLRAAMTVAPRDTSVRVELAQLLAQTQRADEAIALVEEAVLAAPSDAAARESLTRLYIAANQYDRARSAAEDLKTLRPDLPIGFYLAGVVAAEQKRGADAQREFNKALELQPSAVDVLAALTRLDVAAGRTPAAIARATAVVGKYPNNAVARNLLGELQVGSNVLAAAQTQFESAIQLAPKWWIPYRNLGVVRAMRSDIPGAVATYQKGIAATQYESALVTDLANLYENQGRGEEAIKIYEEMLARFPKREFASNNLAMLLVTYRSDADSVNRARDLSASFGSSSNAALLDTFGWVRFKRGDHSEGLAALERAAELAPDSKVVRYHLGMAQLQAGQRDKAKTSLETALAGTPTFMGSGEARTALAGLQGRSG